MSDIQSFLSDFETTCAQIKTLNHDFPEATLLMFLRGALKNTESPPVVGIDGTHYMGPETWLNRQQPDDIDTLEKVKIKLHDRYQVKGDEGKEIVIKQLECLYLTTRKQAILSKIS